MVGSPRTHNDDYAEGVRDGRLSTLEARADKHDEKIDSHERRLIHIERIIYGMVGILFLSSMLPELRELFNAFTK